MKKSQNHTSPVQEDLVDLNKVFREEKGEIYIGGEKIKPEFRSLLREQAKYLLTSQLYEVFVNTARNEANEMALNKSTTWDHVLSAKQLAYWSKIFTSLLVSLSK